MPRAEAAQLEEVLVTGDPDSGPEAADEHGHRCGCGDKLLVAFFALVGAAGLGLSLWPGWDAAHAEECTANRTCTYAEGQAFGHGADAVAASWVSDGREGCCTACTKHVDCAAAIFLDANATGPMVNCIMYPKATLETVSLDGASLCSLPSDGDGATSAARGSLETLLGASAVLTRFGGFAFAFLLGKLLELVGYGGAGTVNTILSPRKAAAAAARAAAGQAEAEGQQAQGAAGWDAIAARKKEPPSTWTDARVALGLSVRQAVWSCGAKMLLWHWTQPLSYLAVFGVYYCSLDDDQRTPGTNMTSRDSGTWVALREALYLVSTLLALWLNPAYLLLELDGVLRPAAEGRGEGRCGWWRRVDGAALKKWVLYLLGPHHYVTMCLYRWVEGAGLINSRPVFWILCLFAGCFQLVADLASAIALLMLLSQPSPPAALAIGYWLTTAGLVAGAGGLVLFFATLAWTGVDDRGNAIPCGLAGRVILGVVYGPIYILGVGSVFVAGACVLVLAPLQLSGAVHGLAP